MNDQKSMRYSQICRYESCWKKMNNYFENLPNELYLEIFDYLEGCQLYEAFSNLNIRFQNLLTSSSLRLKIRLHSHSKSILQYRSSDIIILNRHQIVSLQLTNFNNYDSSLTFFSIDSSFNQLESLQLHDINFNLLLPLLLSLLTLPRLFSLTIVTYTKLQGLTPLYQMIFHLPTLQYSKLSFFSIETFLFTPITTNGRFSDIKYLVIDHCCTLEALIAILSYTPQLSRLSCAKVNQSDGHIDKEPVNIISSLTDISIDKCHVDFDEFEMFITTISSQLQRLRVTCSRDRSYLDADRWERIISQHLTQLRRFEFKYKEMMDEDLQITLYHALINQFNSAFWMKQKWILGISIDTDLLENNVIVYSVFSYEKSPINFHGNKENEEHVLPDGRYSTIQHGIISNKDQSIVSAIIFSEMNQLTVIDHLDSNDDELFTEIIGPILNMVQITCLNITRREIFIGTLIDLIKYLPNLQSLVVSSLVIVPPRRLSIEQVTTLRVIATNNKITRVSLQWMNDLTQVQSLIDLCPRVKYLEVDCTKGVFPQTFVRFILMKSPKYILNLSVTCLKIVRSEENIVEELKRMIDLEQLHHNCTIKQIDNRIYLQWN